MSNERNRLYRTPALNPLPVSDPNNGKGRQLNAPGNQVAAVGYEVLDRAGNRESYRDTRCRPGLSTPLYAPSTLFYED